MFTEDCSGTSNSNPASTLLAHTDVVHSTTEPVDRPTAVFSGNSECLDSSLEGEYASIESQATPSGMQSIREHFTNCKIPADIASVLMHSWRPGTHKQYDVYIKKWTTFCLQRKINSREPNVNHVLTFLHQFHNRQLSYSTINTARSALSSYLMGFQFPGTSYTVSTHPFVVRYLKGVFNCRKPTSRYHETWDVTPVLNYIASLYPLEPLSLKDLTFKLVILLALTSGQRCQTLTFLHTNTMTKSPDNFLFHIQEPIKQERPGKVFNSFLVRRYPKPQLCVYTTLEHYLDRTTQFRDVDRTGLLLSFVKPHCPVGTSTIGRWIKSVLASSGVDTTKFKPHSTRAAAVSKARQTITTDNILAHIGWSSESTFRIFYNKPIVRHGLFDQAVLD